MIDSKESNSDRLTNNIFKRIKEIKDLDNEIKSRLEFLEGLLALKDILVSDLIESIEDLGLVEQLDLIRRIEQIKQAEQIF